MNAQDRIIRSQAQLQALQDQHIALLSGSFNPPHLGHRHVMECALKHQADKVIVFPHSHNPRKTDALLALDVRVEMLHVLLRDSCYEHRIYICDPALYHGIRENLDEISACLGGRQNILILVGGDHLSVRYAPCLRNFRHLIVQRGEAVDAVCHCVLGTPYEIVTEQHPASSTLVRSGSEDERRCYLGADLYQFTKMSGIF